MNAKLKRFKKLHTILVVLYLVLFPLLFLLIGQNEEQSALFCATAMVGLYIISEISSGETVQKLAVELERELEPRKVRVWIPGFKAGQKDPGPYVYTTSIFLTKQGVITTTEDTGIVLVEESCTEKMLAAPSWQKITGDPYRIVMLGKVFTFDPCD